MPDLTPTDAREALRNLIAEKIHAFECGCDSHVDQRGRWDNFVAIADAVMELFPQVVHECSDSTGAWFEVDDSWEPPVTRYALYTEPHPTGVED